MADILDDGDWEGGAAPDSGGHAGPWPAFVDLFAATTLVLLVFFVVIASRYIGETGDVVRVRQLYDKLKELEGANGQFVVQRRGPDVLLILEDSVTFRTSRAELLPAARQTLRQVNRLLDGDQFDGLVREIEVRGHADRRGDRRENWDLSARRAVSVAQFLVDSMDADPCSIVASGRGAYFPRDTLLDPAALPRGDAQLAAYARDRRVEVLLHPTVSKELAASRAGCVDER